MGAVQHVYTCIYLFFFVILYICSDAPGALHNAIVSVHCSLPPAVMSVNICKGFRKGSRQKKTRIFYGQADRKG